VTGAVAAFALTAGMVAQATAGRVVAGAADRAFESVSIDTRTLAAGALFIAIKGERFDGHAFVAEAARRGAAGLLVSSPPGGDAGEASVIQVADTVTALQDLGRAVRRRSGARVVAITGSAGKTTTKEIAADLIATRRRVFRNTGNLNNHVGLPLSLLELRHGPDVAVVEFGMNHAGEIRTLVGIAEPDVRVWINVGDAHLGHFGSRDAVARAKAEILEAAAPGSVLVANADDPLVTRHLAAWSGRIVTFGESAGAAVRASRIVDRGFDGTTAEVATPAGPLHLAVPLAGRAHLMNVLAAVAIALEFDIAAPVIESRVLSLRPVARRGTVTPLAGGGRLVDDSYNASPAAMQAMLASLGATSGAGRRVAVLGEMLELGDAARTLHADCGRAAAKAGVDELVVIGGPAADGLTDGALQGGMARARLHRYADSAAAADAIARIVKAGDLVLVKGSRGTRTDLVVDRLLARAEGAGA
jgi:UDP-N-acetylmuramoyl-tripeptide--D-alanyl-D-alanine ligase